ncbi:FAD binding domain in molybdopterin dehydrogenase [Clostridiales bacterium oral taxon 876 str. F0540]|nr:FAD binding domain in molybdopterin dehydrogenase [Clostridiales bacterium oral taxon 876 str. F0540]
MELQAVIQPVSLKEAKELIHTLPNSRILAGGTDLIIDLNKKKLYADYLVDISKLEELRKIKDFNHHIIVGSMVTFTDILESQIFEERFTCLRDCAEMMGSPQIRNMATIGGNIVNSAAAADIVPCLMSLDAVFIIESVRERRLVRCDDYFKKYDKYRIQSDEILVGIILSDKENISGFYKLGKRNSLSIARLSASVSFEYENNKIHDLKLVLGAVGRFPFRVYEIEYLSRNKDINYLFKKEILAIVEEKVRESIKNRSTMPFKKEAVKGVYTEAVRKALSRGGIIYE